MAGVLDRIPGGNAAWVGLGGRQLRVGGLNFLRVDYRWAVSYGGGGLVGNLGWGFWG